MNEQHVNLDVSKSQGQTQVVRIGQGDKAGTTIVAHVYDNGTELDMTGMAARFEYRLPYSAGYVQDPQVTVSGSTLIYVVDEEHCAAVAGVTEEAYFSILQGDSVIASTSRFSVRVLRAASKGADPAGMYTDDVKQATKAAREAADAANEAAQQIGTAVEDAKEAAETAAQAVTDAQTAIQDADTAKQSAITAANQATAAASLANQRATEAGAATAAADTATSRANDATDRAESAIDAMGDISEQAVPLMSADVRGGAKLGNGLTVEDGMLRVIGLYVDEDGDWCQV